MNSYEVIVYLALDETREYAVYALDSNRKRIHEEIRTRNFETFLDFMRALETQAL